jgi:hypothetical protein
VQSVAPLLRHIRRCCMSFMTVQQGCPLEALCVSPMFSGQLCYLVFSLGVEYRDKFYPVFPSISRQVLVLLTPWSTVLPVKLIVAQIFKKFPTLYGGYKITPLVSVLNEMNLSKLYILLHGSLRSILTLYSSRLPLFIHFFFQPELCMHITFVSCVLHEPPTAFSSN